MKTMRLLLSLGFSFFLLVGCSLKLDSSGGILPNLKGGQMPPSSGTDAGGNTTGTSQLQGKKGTKSAIINLKINAYVAQETGLRTYLNCVQLAQLDTGSVVVDFSNLPCPTNSSATVVPESIKFTATYNLLRDSDYELIYQNRTIGLMRVNSQVPEVLLEAACSGTYDTHCLISTTPDGKLDAISVF